jgi:hypothetical protein
VGLTHVADRRAHLVTALILAVGLTAALVIYLTAATPDDSAIDPADSKQYLRQMELYGGKANLLAAEIRAWFASLWHGRRLALTVAVVTVAAAVGYWLVAAPLPSDLERAGPRPPRGD